MSGDSCGSDSWAAPGMEWVEDRDISQHSAGPSVSYQKMT
jgi:hypothetical protein